jgi:hypothetical protein
MAQKYKTPDINEATLINNPFIGTLTIGVTRRVDEKTFIADEDGDFYNKEFELENDISVRVYVSADRRKRLNALSPNSTKLLNWCFQEFDSNKDWFWLNKQRYMDETGVAYNTYKKSVKELQDNNLILKTSYNDVFWINPHYFFRGNRVKFYRPHKGVVTVTKDLAKDSIDFEAIVKKRKEKQNKK